MRSHTNIDIFKRLIFCQLISIALILADPDSLIYPELANAAVIEEMAEGESSIKVSFEEELKFKTKAQFSYKGFKFNYKNEGAWNEEIDQLTSLSYSWKRFFLASGRGQPHIAHGMILGNTMMRFSPAISGQAGLRPAKMKAGTYEQYKQLSLLGVRIKSAEIRLFRFDGVHGAILEIHDKGRLGGLGCYVAEKIVLESWVSYKDENWKLSYSNSFSDWKFNHFSADALYGIRNLKLFIATTWLSKEFYGIKRDSKWGSGLEPGSRGYALGFNLIESPWRLSGMAYDISGELRNESRCTLETRFRDNPFEITGAYIYKKIREIHESENFPFGNFWVNEIDHNIKMNIKTKINPKLQMALQIQGVIFQSTSYVALFRFSHKTSNGTLKFQLTQCSGIESDLYFIRPSGDTYYGIRKAPDEETLYLDLIYLKKLDKFDVFIHLRNEGVSVGISYE